MRESKEPAYKKHTLDNRRWKQALIVLLLLSLPLDMRSQQPQTVPSIGSLTLLDTEGHPQRFQAPRGSVTVVMFFSTRCPMSNAFNYRRNLLYRTYKDRVRFLVIDPNVNESVQEVRAYAKEAGFDFPIYEDINNQVADLFGARNTTENFLLDSTGVIRYRGYIEDAANPERTTNPALRLAIESILAGQPVAAPDTHGIGCAIRRAHPQH